MASLYKKTFDQILTEILTDYSNLDSSPDISQGSMPFISSSVIATAVFGLYKFNEYNAKQNFADTADHENLLRHGAILDIPYLDTDTDATYLNKVLRFLRQPPAGGNKQDFEDWAIDQSNSVYVDSDITYYNAYVTVIDNFDGAGTVGIFTIPNDETVIDASLPAVYPGNIEELLRIATETYIHTEQPLGILSSSIQSSKPVLQNITMTVSASESLDTAAIIQAIEDNLNLMVPGETLYLDTIKSIALSYGSKNAPISTPSGDVSAANAEHIRPGIITVTEV